MRLRHNAALSAASAALLAAAPPEAPKRPVTDTYHGVAVVDDYRWLEQWTDPEVQAWSEAQNARARAVLDALPRVDAIRAEVTRLRKLAVRRTTGLKAAGPSLFALLRDPALQQPVLVVMASEDDPGAARILVDPNALDPRGGTSIDWFEPSPDGRKLAVSLSRGGSERGDVHVFEVATGKSVDEVVPRVNYGTALGSLAWDHDGSGFLYTRYPREGERPAQDMDFYVQVYHHRLGSPSAQDRYEIGKDFPRIAEIKLQASPDGRFALANVQDGDGGMFQQYLRGPDGRWTQLTRWQDKVVQAVFVDGALLLGSRADAPRGKVLRLALDPARPPALATATLLPEGEGVIAFTFLGAGGMVAGRERLFVEEIVGGPERVRVTDLAGREQEPLPVPPVSSVAEIVPLPGRQPEAVLFRVEGPLTPAAWYRAQPGKAAVKVALSPAWPLDFADAEVVREEAVSKDGTRVPMTIVRRKGIGLDGSHPVLLSGYGGYGLSQAPGFDAGVRFWLDRGGVIVETNLRGGAEFGEAWHRAGSLTRKQNVFDDFIACAEHLVKRGYTRPSRLAIEGGSNGGLLMGAVLTQRPELFGAVVSHVGIYDMLRVELSPNGAFNVPEFGTVKDRAQFEALFAYSPYHHVVDGRKYPPVLLLTGANDARVDPMHSRKMTARLQAAGAGVLLRTSAHTGHGSGTRLDDAIEKEVDVLAFLLDRLGMNAAGK